MADTGLGSAILQGMTAGQLLGDRIAALRANNRMQDLQNDVSSGKYNASAYGGDDAAAQQALQDATRVAQDPLSARGLDQSYGSGQYGRIQDLMNLRAQQQGSDMVNAGDVAGGARRSAVGSAIMGNMPGAIQANQFAGNVDAGTNAITQAGDGSGLAAGQINPQTLAGGVAQNAARYGDVSGAQQAGGQEMQGRDALIQRNLGQGLTVAMNPALGGMDAAAGHFDAAAKLAGYGGVSRDSQGGYWVTDKQGHGVTQLTPENIQQFAQTVGTDPSNIMPMLRQQQQLAAQDQHDFSKMTNETAMKAAIDAASKAGDPALLRSLTGEAKISLQQAKTGGWDIKGQAQPVTDKDGKPVGNAYLVTNEATGQPMRMVVSSGGSDDPDAPQTITLEDYQGRQIDPNSLPAKAQATLESAKRAVRMQALQDYYTVSAQQGAMQQQGIEAARRGYLGQQGGPGSFTMPGQQSSSAMGGGQRATPATLMPQGNSKWEQDARNYQSPLVAIDNAHMLQESGGNPNAVSSAGARSVMQLMGPTAREMERRLGMPEGETDRNPAANYYAGRVYRDTLYKDALAKTGDPAIATQYALSAYNAGPGGVNKAANAGKLPTETQNYAPSILRKAGAMSGGATKPQAKITGKDATPIQARNNSLVTNADRFLLGGR